MEGSQHLGCGPSKGSVSSSYTLLDASHLSSVETLFSQYSGPFKNKIIPYESVNLLSVGGGDFRVFLCCLFPIRLLRVPFFILSRANLSFINCPLTCDFTAKPIHIYFLKVGRGGECEFHLLKSKYQGLLNSRNYHINPQALGQAISLRNRSSIFFCLSLTTIKCNLRK